MDTPWLEELEQRVQTAAEQIAHLRRENRQLRDRLEAAGAGGTVESEAWRDERDEVRRRVEALAARLEGLLE